ncbi:MAG: hypothetical protein Q8L86_12580 [Vicinamibacterales bacterium]|nr:hypothetical protein [Vicinamibacterales bacterium]
MTHAEDLDKVVRAALHQLTAIEARLTTPGLAAKAAERNVALCLIDAQSTWGLFFRAFFISSFIGAKRGGGGRVTITAPGSRSPTDAIRWAAVANNARLAGQARIAPLDEPRWHQPNTLLRLAQRAGFSNAPQIQVAFGVPGRAFEDLPKARNFYAHRSHHTANQVKALIGRYGLPAKIRAGEIAGHPHMTRPGSIAEYWLAQVIATIRLMPQ